ncbi:MAG: hypothetical protein ABSA77_12735 [Thermoguttaceae bacterium]|jgi:hypothetical protein
MSITTVSAVPKYRHHKGTDQAFIQIKGRRRYLGKWNSQKSRERYAAFIAELAVRPTALPMLKAESQITITVLAAAYWEFVQSLLRQERKAFRLAGTYPPDAMEGS